METEITKSKISQELREDEVTMWPKLESGILVIAADAIDELTASSIKDREEIRRLKLELEDLRKSQPHDQSQKLYANLKDMESWASTLAKFSLPKRYKDGFFKSWESTQEALAEFRVKYPQKEGEEDE